MTESALSAALRLIAGGNTLEALSRLFRQPGDEPLEALNRVLYSHTREISNPIVQQEKERHESLLASVTGRERAMVFYNLGCLALYQDEIVQARLYFEQALALWPEWVPIRHNLAFTLELMADGESAERLYREVLRQDPAFTLSRLNLALLLTQYDREEDGLAELRALVAESPGSASLVLYAARTLLQRGSKADAEEVLAMLDKVEDWPGYPDLKECHAFACYLLGRFAEAESAFRALLAEDTYNLFARLGLIQILAARREWQELGTHAKRLHEINPTDQTAELLGQLQQAGELI